MAEKMKRFWCSWIQSGRDIRPYQYPPPENILGWWQSGETADGSATLCACVEAYNVDGLIAAIRQPQAWPDAGTLRLIRSVDGDFVPGDRFPLEDWMKPRFGQ